MGRKFYKMKLIKMKKSQEKYNQETGLKSFINSKPTKQYIEWLENSFQEKDPKILTWLKKMFNHAEKKEWFETYHSIDIHGTISKPDYRKNITKKTLNYYPYAKETLKLMTDRKDIILILYSSSYPEEIETYIKQFAESGIKFNYINENPEVSDAKGSFGYYDKKFYFNSLIDDKSGFSPEKDWKFLYDYFLSTNYKPNTKWSTKTDESYHIK